MFPFPFTVVALVAWLVTLLSHGSYRDTLPLSYRVQNICLSFFLVFFSSIGIFSFWWRVFHPEQLPAFFMRESLFPPVIGLVVVVLSVCAAHVEMLIGFWMAQQKRRARTLTRAVMPYLLVIEILSCIRTSAWFRPEVVRLGLQSFVPVEVVLFVWIYLFCGSKQAEELMTHN